MQSVRDLIKQLSKMSEEHKDKPITIICPNGLRVYPEVKYKRAEDFDFTSPIEEVVLSWD